MMSQIVVLVALFCMVSYTKGLPNTCDCQSQIRQYSAENEILRQSTDAQSQEFDRKIQEMQQQIDDMDQLFKSHARAVDQQVDKTQAEVATLTEDTRNVFIGFAAFSNVDEYYTERGETLVFNQVSTNEGGGYNSANGIFTVPVTGWYYFGLSIFSKDHHDSHQIMKSGDKYPGAFGDTGNHDQGAVSWVMLCTAGETVYVQQYHPTGGGVWRGNSDDDQLNSFIGFLILQIF